MRLPPHRRLAVWGGQQINLIRVFCGSQYFMLFHAKRVAIELSVREIKRWPTSLATAQSKKDEFAMQF
jgi:hypothetical protein